MGNGGPQGQGGARPPQIPQGAPADLKDFVSCKAASVTLRSGKVNWIPGLPEVDVTITPGPGPGEVEIRAQWGDGFITLPLGLTVKAGRLELDTSQVPDFVPGAKEEITSWAERLNDWFRSNGKQLAPLKVKDGTITMTKVAMPAASKPLVVPGTETRFPGVVTSGPLPGPVGTRGGAQPQPVAPAGPKVTPQDVEAQRSKVAAARERFDAEDKRREENAEHSDHFARRPRRWAAPPDERAIEQRREQLDRERQRIADDHEKALSAYLREADRLQQMESALQQAPAAPVGPTGRAPQHRGPGWTPPPDVHEEEVKKWSRTWWARGSLAALLAAAVVGGYFLFRGDDQAPPGQAQRPPELRDITVSFATGEMLTYEGPTVVRTGMPFTVRFCVVNPDGNPVAGEEVFSTLAVVPSGPTASHGSDTTDKNGCGDILLDVNEPPGRSVLWFSYRQEVVRGTDMDVRPS